MSGWFRVSTTSPAPKRIHVSPAVVKKTREETAWSCSDPGAPPPSAMPSTTLSKCPITGAWCYIGFIGWHQHRDPSNICLENPLALCKDSLISQMENYAFGDLRWFLLRRGIFGKSPVLWCTERSRGLPKGRQQSHDSAAHFPLQLLAFSVWTGSLSALADSFKYLFRQHPLVLSLFWISQPRKHLFSVFPSQLMCWNSTHSFMNMQGSQFLFGKKG